MEAKKLSFKDLISIKNNFKERTDALRDKLERLEKEMDEKNGELMMLREKTANLETNS